MAKTTTVTTFDNSIKRISFNFKNAKMQFQLIVMDN